MDTILINGKIYTMDNRRNIVEAIGIKGDIIQKLGTNDEVMLFGTENTRVHDLEGRAVLPGFNDSHMHLLNYGFFLTLVDLVGVTSIEEMNNRVKDSILDNNVEKGKWISGMGWNQDYFKGDKVFPTKYDLDKISKEHPIVLTRVCGHAVVVNSKALQVLNITRDSLQIEGGHFDLDEDGQPTGVFKENAVSLVYENLPSPSVEEIKGMMVNAIDHMNKSGITSVGSDDLRAMSDKNYENVIQAYLELKDEGKLKIRVYEQCLIPDINKFKEFINGGYYSGWGDNNFKIGPLKLLLDGSLGARTAALVEPYSDDTTTRGITIATQDELDQIVELAHNNNFHVIIHGIGDRAMYMAFKSIEKALFKYPKDDHRHGIVHCQITDQDLLDKFEELDVIAYIQPIFLDYDWNIVRDRVGEAREKLSYNWKTMVDKGIKIACGSDAPVETFNVFKGIYEAVTRKDLQGNPVGGWLPDQKLTIDEAIYGYTMGGAYASFEEDIKGSLEVGKLADMVVISDDIFNIEEDKIKDIEVVATIFAGKMI